MNDIYHDEDGNCRGGLSCPPCNDELERRGEKRLDAPAKADTIARPSVSAEDFLRDHLSDPEIAARYAAAEAEMANTAAPITDDELRAYIETGAERGFHATTIRMARELLAARTQSRGQGEHYAMTCMRRHYEDVEQSLRAEIAEKDATIARLEGELAGHALTATCDCSGYTRDDAAIPCACGHGEDEHEGRCRADVRANDPRAALAGENPEATR
jgi:hypothetical protein